MRIIHSSDAPEAIGPYSQATKTDSLIFASGQIAIDPHTGDFIGGDITAQTKRTLENIDAVITQAGANRKKVLMCNVYLKNLSDFAAFNDVYADFFGEHRPARVTVEVSNLPKAALIEISAIAEI